MIIRVTLKDSLFFLLPGGMGVIPEGSLAVLLCLRIYAWERHGDIIIYYLDADLRGRLGV